MANDQRALEDGIRLPARQILAWALRIVSFSRSLIGFSQRTDYHLIRRTKLNVALLPALGQKASKPKTLKPHARMDTRACSKVLMQLNRLCVLHLQRNPMSGIAIRISVQIQWAILGLHMSMRASIRRVFRNL